MQLMLMAKCELAKYAKYDIRKAKHRWAEWKKKTEDCTSITEKKKKWGTNLIKKGLNEDKQDKVRRKKSEKQKGEIRECEL